MAKMPEIEVRIRTIEETPAPWWAWALICLGTVAALAASLWMWVAFIRWACR